MTTDILLTILPRGAPAALLLELAIKGSVLLLLGLLATRCSRRSSAAVRHWVWVAVFGALLALPLLAVVAPGWQLPVPLPAHQAAPHPAAAGALQSLAEGTSIAAEASGPAANPPEAQRIEAGSFLLIGWVYGGGALLLLLTGTYLRRALEVERARSVRSGRAFSVLQRLCRRTGVVRLPRLVETAADSMPTTSGVLRPVVGLPVGAVDRWPEERLESVLLHELAHIRRRDLLVQLLAQVACTLHWYNPLVWRAMRQLRLESEMACDDLVVASGVRASSYGDLLLRLAREQRRRPLPALAWIPAADRSQLPTRLQALFDASRRHGRASVGVIAGILFAATALAAVVATASGATGTPGASERLGQSTIDPLTPVAGARPFVVGDNEPTLIGPASTPMLQPAANPADTIPPALLNRDAVEEAIRRSYPPELRQQGVSGTALVELQVDSSGTVAAIRVLNSSDGAFARAAPEALRTAHFRPARTDDRPVAMVIHWPVAYNAYDDGRDLREMERALAEARILREMEAREMLRQAERVRRQTEERALRTLLIEQQAEMARLRALEAGPEEAAALEREREAALKAVEMLEAQLQARAATVGSAPQAQPPGRVVGSVVDAGGIPIPGAVVTVRGRTQGATTDRNGQFAIVALPPGSYTLEVSIPETAQTGSTDVVVSPRETTTATVTVASSGDR